MLQHTKGTVNKQHTFFTSNLYISDMPQFLLPGCLCCDKNKRVNVFKVKKISFATQTVTLGRPVSILEKRDHSRAVMLCELLYTDWNSPVLKMLPPSVTKQTKLKEF